MKIRVKAPWLHQKWPRSTGPLSEKGRDKSLGPLYMLIMKKKDVHFILWGWKVQWNHCVWINVQRDTPLPRNFFVFILSPCWCCVPHPRHLHGFQLFQSGTCAKRRSLVAQHPPSLITYVTHVPPLLLTIINIHMADKLMASNADEKTNVSNISCWVDIIGCITCMWQLTGFLWIQA